MTDTVSRVQHIEGLLTRALSPRDSQVKAQVKRNSFGWLHLKVVTSVFEEQDDDERQDQINALLKEINLHLEEYPFATYQLLTPQEAVEQFQLLPVHIPLWSEILSLSEVDEETLQQAEEKKSKNEKRPFVVTFYSFKGSVGRSTSLAFVANILATGGYRIVMIDFDLEAPGLSSAQAVDNLGAHTPGVLDYVHQRYLIPEEHTPGLEDCVRQISISARGELYLIPAGAYDEGYIHRLADLDVRALYQRETNPIRQLLEDVKRSLDPDIILIDARPGFTEIGAVALFDLADLGIICFSPTKQSYAGLQWVVEAARKQRKYTGIPDLRFLLTSLPPVAQNQLQEWLGQTADWIAQHWDISPTLTVDECYYHVPYDPHIMTLDSLFADVPEHILTSYEPVADAIRASLPEDIPAAPEYAE
jgi:MinD-like ATPase involved in chromosome partitioning or flagellar assembly